MQTSSIIGLPWQLAEGLLRAAKIPFAVTIGDNYNRFFYSGRLQLLCRSRYD